MNISKKRVMLALLIAIALILLAQAASTATVNTDAVAIDATDANMTITLPKYGEVNTIIECPLWDFDTASCPKWQKSSLNFEQNETHIWLTTQKSHAYAGAYETPQTTKKYKTKDELNVKIKNKKGDETGTVETEAIDDTITLRAEDGETTLLIRGVQATTDFEIKIGEADGNPLIAVQRTNASEELTIDNATITLPKTRIIKAIRYCADPDFDFETLTCSNWVVTNIPFEDNGNTITFTVEHFSAYSGLSAVTISGVNLSKYGAADNMPLNYSGLAAWYRLEKGNGSFWNDSSGNGNFGVYNGSASAKPTYTAEGAVGGSYKFDGINDKITVNDTSSLQFTETSAFSVSLWVKGQYSGAAIQSELVSKRFSNDRYELSFTNANKLQAQMSDGTNVLTVTTTSNMNDSKWHHSVLTYDGNNNLRLYVDNSLIGTDTSPTLSGLMPSPATLTIGHGSNGISNVTLDEIMIFNRSLSQAEITNLYNRTRNIYTDHDLGASIVNSSEPESNTTVSYVYDWRKDGTSIAVLNMPFNLNGSAGGTDSWINVSDYSSYGNNAVTNGTNSTMPRWNRTGGYDGFGAYEFDGTDDSLTLNANTTTSSMTLSLWLKTNKDEIKNISTGASHSCALMQTGDVYCWGSNLYGQIGDGTTTQRNIPTKTRMTAATQISTGYTHTCATNSSGMYCWGFNGNGQLGDGSVTSSPIPTKALMTAATQITAGWYHTCATNASGMYCWGHNLNGAIGNGTATTAGAYAVAFPTLNHMNTTSTSLISAGWYHTCATNASGMYCWGRNDQGQIGNGSNATTSPFPTLNYMNTTTTSQIATGYMHVCATNASGMYCWGYNYDGEIGNGTKTLAYPYSVLFPTLNFMNTTSTSLISAGYTHTCATNATGMYCWGYNNNGQAGIGAISATTSPTKNNMNTTSASQIATGYHTCATNASGVYCWGSNLYGQMGNGSTGTTNFNPIPTTWELLTLTRKAFSTSPDWAQELLTNITANRTDGTALTTLQNLYGDNSWHFLTITKDANSLKTYRNGALIYDVPNATAAATTLTAIGRANINSYYNGTIDQVQIFNRTLTPEQIKEMYADGQGGYNRLVSQETAENDNWTVAATPIDGYEDGSLYTSNIAEILQKLTLNWTAAYNTSGKEINTTTWAVGGQNITFNATVLDPDHLASTVWVIVWKTIKEAGQILWEGIMTLANGIYSIVMPTNTSFPHNVNYTIYANDSNMIETSVNGTFFYNYRPEMNGVNLSKYGAANNQAVNYSGLAGWWRLEKGNRSYWNDSSGNGNFGVYNGSASTKPAYTAEGTVGGAHKFDGRDDYVTVSSNNGLQPADALTISAWVNIKNLESAPSDKQGIIDSTGSASWGGFELDYQESLNAWELYAYNSTSGVYNSVGNHYIYSNADATVNTWTHLVGVFNGTSIQMYVNGILQTDKELMTSIIYADAGTNLEIGRFYATNYNFNGSIDEVMLWNRSLSAAEILNLYNRTKNIYTDHDLGASIVNATDNDNDTISYAYDWREDGASIAVLNMPFELNGTGGSLGNWTTAKDYSTYANNAEYNGTTSAMPRWNRTGGYDGFGAYEFDGTDDHLILNANTTTSAMTLSLWLKTNKDEIKNISSGSAYTCALMQNGDIYCWGENIYGQIGDGTTTYRNIPTKTQITAATKVTTGASHTCATNSTGMYCWGRNSYGQLGDGSVISKSVPTKTLMTAATAIKVAHYNTCATNASGMYCWGYNLYGQIGNGSNTTAANPFPSKNYMNTTPNGQITGGLSFTCATNTTGMYCWGYNNVGQIGNGTNSTDPNPFPTLNYMNTTSASQISAGTYDVCATNASGMYCWGRNQLGEIGNGTPTPSPYIVNFPTKNYMNTTLTSQIVVGDYHTCATNDSGMYCWGYNLYGQMGNGSSASTNPFPTKNYMNTTSTSQITSGLFHTCATNDSGMYCWGSNLYGQLGNGSTASVNSVPMPVTWDILTLSRKAFSTSPDWAQEILVNITANRTDGTALTTLQNLYGDNNWHFLTITKDANSLKTYRNGALIYDIPNTTAAATTLTAIGRLTNDGYYNGTIDQLQLYNRTLTPEQIKEMYADGIGGYNRLVSQETAENDNWTVTATPIDGYEDGSLYTSNIAEILQKLTLNWTAAYNTSGAQVNTTTWAAGGQNITFNATVLDPDNLKSTVWVVVWQTVKATGVKIWEGIMTLVNGIYSIVFETNTSLGHNVNYTIYANDTNMIETSADGTFFYNYKPTLNGVNLSKYGAAENQAVNYSGLAGWWRLEQGNGSFWNDSSGNGNFGVSRNSSEAVRPTYTAEGTVGGAYKFDSIYDYIKVEEDSSLDISATGGMTFSAWVYPKSLTGNHVLFGKNDGGLTSDTGYYIYDDDAVLAIAYNNGTGSAEALANSAFSQTLNKWQHIVVVIDRASESVTFYRDGNKGDTDSENKDGSWDNSQDLTIGTLSNSVVTWNFNGSMDEVMIWNRSLSDAEVLNLYNRTRNVYTDHDLGASVVNATDNDNDTISYAYDWREDGTSIAVLNMPFELNGTGGSLGNWTTAKDYSTYSNNAEYNGSKEAMPRWNRTGGYDGFGAYEFDGTDDHLILNANTTTNDMTLSLWLKTNKDEIKNITAGTYHTCALMHSGDLYCWGYNTNGQIGDGTTTQRNIPTKTQMTAATQITVGYLHTCATNASGMYCWGNNGNGRLGDGSATSSPIPTKALMTAAAQITAGYYHTCVTNATGMYCWGESQYGQIGNGSNATSSPFPTKNYMTNATQITAGYRHTCATNATGMYCWGENQYGQIGNGSNATINPFPTKNYMNTTSTSLISARYWHTCATNDSGMYCWGHNRYGAIGNGTATTASPYAVEFPTLNYMNITSTSLISAEIYHTCATNSSGMYCWGYNSNGQIGNGSNSTTANQFPTKNNMNTTTNSQITAGFAYTCATNSSGIYCWGDSAFGQMGNGSTASINKFPTQVIWELLTLTRKAFTISPDWAQELLVNITANRTDGTALTTLQNLYGDNNWHFLTITKDANSLKTYRDGALIYDIPNTTAAATTLTAIGRLTNDGYYNGTIDQLQLYNRTLTLEQIQEMYADGAGGYNRLVSQETAENDNWTVAATPIDGYEDGSLYTSNIAEILQKLTLNWTAAYNTSGKEINTTTWAAGGQNITFNATVLDPDNLASTVWVVVWQTVKETGIKIWEGIMTLVNGIYSIVFETNTSLGHNVNYTIYANDTNMIETSVNGTFFYNYKPTLNGVNLSKYGAANNQAVNYSGLAGWWKLEQGNGSFWNDSSGNANFGVYNGSASTQPAYTAEGTVGGAYNFDGDNDFIKDSTTPIGNSSLSVSLWVKGNLTTTPIILYSGHLAQPGIMVIGSFIAGTNSNMYIFQIRATNGSYYRVQSSGVSKNDWHHLVGTYNTSDVRPANLYVDNVPSNSFLGTAYLSSLADSIFTISSRVGTQFFYNGSIDEVMVWNRSLSDAEITNLYNRTKNIYTDHDLGASIVNATDEDNDTISYVYDWRKDGNSMALLNLPFELNGTGGSLGNWTTAKDYSTYGNNAEYNGTASAMPRWNKTGGYDSKGAYEFDGTDDSLNLNANTTTSAMTLSLWLKTNKDEIKNISAGKYHSCALMRSGDLYCWGVGTLGQMGDGTSTSKMIPTKSLMAAATQITLGYYHTCATNDSGMYCWGYGSEGEIGNGAISSTNKLPIRNYMTNPSKIAAGGYHTCATNDSGMYCWGRSHYGQIGNGSNATASPFPTKNYMNTTPNGQIAAGGYHTCATNDSGMYCWGYNIYGQIGNGTATTASPYMVTYPTLSQMNLTPSTPNGQMALGDYHMCATNDSGMYCWGLATNGRLGNGSTSGTYPSPILIPMNITPNGRIAAGGYHACATNASGMYCWGRNDNGHLGLGDTTQRTTPTKNYMNTTPDGQIAAGYEYTCATNSSGIYCWGNSIYGQMGNGSTATTNEFPTPVTWDILTLSRKAFSTSPDWAQEILVNITANRTDGTALSTLTNLYGDNNWHLLTITKDASSLKTYRNGALIYDIPNTTAAATTLTAIGRLTNDGYYNGTIDQVQIFNRTLTPEQIKEMYADGQGGYNRLVHNELAENDNWTVAATPIDGYEDGSLYTSNIAEILQKLTLNWTAAYNTSGKEVNTTTWAAGGQNLTLNATVLDPDNLKSTVWAVVWQTIKETGIKIWEGIMALANGIYSIVMPTNTSFPHNVNYTIYANDTNMIETSANGTFFYNYKPNITAANLAATLSNNYTTENLTLSVTASDSDLDAYNYTYDWRINGTSIAVLNLPFNLNGTGGSLGNWTTAKDYSTYGNNAQYNGSISAMPRWNRTGGYDGRGAYEFDGTDDYIRRGSLGSGIANYTISLWFNQKVNPAGTNYYISTGATTPAIGIVSGSLRIYDGTTGTSLSTITSGTWYHVAMTVNSTGLDAYLNGANIFSTGSRTDLGTTGIEIGRGGAGYETNATIDQVQIFNRTLTPDQVQSLYSHGYDRIIKNETRKGEKWQAAITPNDAYEDGATFYTANLTIRNYPPATPSLTTANNTNTSDNTPTIEWSQSYDNDSDAVTYITQVTQNDFTAINHTNTSIAANSDTSYTLADGVYSWRALSNDGEDNGTWSSNYTITIDTTAPTLTPYRPANNTGTNKNITINYTSNDLTAIINCTLKLNEAYNATIYTNTTTNTSISNGTTLNFNLYNISAGRYRWNITCTDTVNNIRTSENRYLIVAPRATFSGATTDLTQANLSNITALTIDQVYSGLINFTQTIDLSNGTDIDSYVNISNNRISIDTTLAPQLNKAAILTFYNLTYSNPRPVKDGSACSNTICTEISYDATTKVYQYSVTGFSTYSAEETPVVSAATAAGGGSESGGYGGSGPGGTERFTADKSQMTIKMALKEAKEDSITITNTGTIPLTLTIKPSNLKGKLTITDTEFTLNKGESKEVKLYFISGKAPGVTFGTLEISTATQRIEIPIAIEVETEEVLFDAAIDILPTKQAVSAGEALPAQVTLLSVGSPRKVDVTLHYTIRDSKGNTLLEESETTAVEGQKSFMKQFFIPSDAKTGNYVITVEVLYATTVATASQMFSLIPPKAQIALTAKKNTQVLMVLAAASVLAAIGMAIILRGRKEQPRFYKN